MGEFNRGPRRNFGGPREPREMHEATCSECGKKCEVPFKPDPEKKVYCKECYEKRRPQRY